MEDSPWVTGIKQQILIIKKNYFVLWEVNKFSIWGRFLMFSVNRGGGEENPY